MITKDDDIFSCVPLPSSVFFAEASESFVHFLTGLFIFLIIEFLGTFPYSGYKSFIKHVICKYFFQSVACPFVRLAVLKKDLFTSNYTRL